MRQYRCNGLGVACDIDNNVIDMQTDNDANRTWMSSRGSMGRINDAT